MSKQKILLVDDDQEMCEELKSILEDAQYAVDMIHDGSMAVSKIEQENFDILLLDLKIPGLDGYEVLKYCKLVHPSIKTIIITGNPLTPHTIDSRDQVFPYKDEYKGTILELTDSFLNKPFDVAEVLKEIKSLLDK